MNLSALANGVIKAVSPNIRLSVQLSTGYTVSSDGTQVPTYADPVSVWGQVQPLSYRDIQQADAMNLQGTRKAIYVNGLTDSVDRPSARGGDLITVEGGPDAGLYLVAQIDENWEGTWTKCICTRQVVDA